MSNGQFGQLLSQQTNQYNGSSIKYVVYCGMQNSCETKLPLLSNGSANNHVSKATNAVQQKNCVLKHPIGDNVKR
jgi:hypothetical protein